MKTITLIRLSVLAAATLMLGACASKPTVTSQTVTHESSTTEVPPAASSSTTTTTTH